MMRRAQPWLGTLVEVGIARAPDPLVVIDAAYAAVARVDRLMSRQRAGSDVGRLNTAQSGTALVVDPWTARVLELACELHGRTQGTFDPSGLGRASCGYGQDGARAWRTDDRARISLDGIAKGYAVDRAVEAMRAAGATDGWVNAGGDLRAFGELALPVELRLGGTRRGIIVEGAALASSEFGRTRPSGATATLRGRRGRRPRALGAAVLAPECWIADALTKVIAVAGHDCRAWLAAYGATLVWRA